MKRALALLLLCGCSAVALTQYKAGLKACDDNSASAAEDDKCKAEWRNRWDEAGARPAAVLDGGIQ